MGIIGGVNGGLWGALKDIWMASGVAFVGWSCSRRGIA